ncbi:MAG: hypothetical protein Q9163_005344, partial [Psora crenata]
MGNTPSLPEKTPSLPPEPASACPVHPSTREAWLTAAAASKSRTPPPPPDARASPAPRLTKEHALGSERVISSIPRANTITTSSSSSTPPTTTTPSPISLPIPSSGSPHSHPTADNAQRWIYPSEKMFFEAMRRKSFSPNPGDMATIVPIHNAVNERAWSEILSWECSSPSAAKANEACGGPKLRSFTGDSKKMTPRAR